MSELMNVSNARPIVALSGGVDSALVAFLLKSQGFAVEALHMTNWDDDEDGYCTARDDLKAARSVADFLQIPLHHVSFAKEYREQIFSDFLAQYAEGLTPNPDILCNREVKFGACLSYMQRLGGTHLATGHYAKIVKGPSEYELHRGSDHLKDQSYFLQQMPIEALSKACFPLGDYQKSKVRAQALAAGLPVHARQDSTGICFIGERPFRAFLSRYIHASPGPIENVDGTVVGEHEGLAYYTIGQRQGLKIGGRLHGSGLPWYVARKEIARNALIVAQGENHPALLSRRFWISGMHWLTHSLEPWVNPTSPRSLKPLSIQIRHRGERISARLTPLSECAFNHLAKLDATPITDLSAYFTAPFWQIDLTEPFRYVAPGQFAAVYDDERCLGGAKITYAQTLEGDIIGRLKERP
jgi:tRNA-specific 2-thiouridylase